MVKNVGILVSIDCIYKKTLVLKYFYIFVSILLLIEFETHISLANISFLHFFLKSVPKT